MGPALVILVTVVVGLVVLARKRSRFRLRDRLHPHPGVRAELASITRQRSITQNALVCEAVLEAQKANFRRMLEQGEHQRIASTLRPGPDYSLHIRALAEIGTDEAGRLIESQLDNSLNLDPDELGTYRADLARSLRQLDRTNCLPSLLQGMSEILTRPAGVALAGELVRFDSFGDFLTCSDAPTRRASLRTLRRVLEAIRARELPLGLIAEARLGELIAGLARNVEGNTPEPALIGVLLEGLRHYRRAEHTERFLGGEESTQEPHHWQYACLFEVSDRILDALDRAAGEIPQTCPDPASPAFSEWLEAVDALRLDVGPFLLSMTEPDIDRHAEQILKCLRWTSDPRVSDFLLSRLRFAPLLGNDQEALVVLEVLRSHPGVEVERELIRQARFGDPARRCAAVGSLGWWTPNFPIEVVETLRQAASCGSSEMRLRADAGLARLGDRSGLSRLRARLTLEESIGVAEVITAIEREGVSWLWPELDRLVDSEDLEVAFAACEALECAREDLFGPLHD